MSKDKNKIYEEVHNYTKFKLVVEMLIDKHLDKKLKSMNAIEQIADDVLATLAISGMKYYSELKKEFK
tara:strand:- start:224 stop:427 length:204 start_codon:yes stop_codon:yes gene_type:complete